MTLRLDGRVAIVTGAGRGIGRAYAHLLADLGAHVVVNDIGGSMSGEGTDDGPAAAVVAEITGAGGEAVADTSDVSAVDGAAALVEAAISSFGQLDALVNNAGIMRWATFPDVPDEDLDAHLAVHTQGAFLTAREAWPHLVASDAGRIVNTASAGVFGLAANTSYATAKGGVIGLTRSLAVAGTDVGIAANVVAPAAWTRMAGPEPDDHGMAPELVAPMVAYLVPPDCPATGEIYAAGARRFARIVIAQAQGHLHDEPSPTIDDVAANWDAINDETDAWVPRDLTDWSQRFMAHLADR